MFDLMHGKVARAAFSCSKHLRRSETYCAKPCLSKVKVFMIRRVHYACCERVFLYSNGSFSIAI
jgi:hypothetical protein